MNSKNFALFGGSFDPPHKGHQEIVESLLKLEKIDSVLIVPTYKNPFKDSFHATPKQRLKWCQTLFSSPNIVVSDYEILQQRPVYTIETYNALSKIYNIKAIVIGADNLKSITKWRDFEKLNSKIEWIIATRPNEELDTSALQNYTLLPLNIDISSSEIREGKKLEFVDSSIRKQVQKVYNIAKNQD